MLWLRLSCSLAPLLAQRDASDRVVSFPMSGPHVTEMGDASGPGPVRKEALSSSAIEGSVEAECPQ